MTNSPIGGGYEKRDGNYSGKHDGDGGYESEHSDKRENLGEEHCKFIEPGVI